MEQFEQPKPSSAGEPKDLSEANAAPAAEGVVDITVLEHLEEVILTIGEEPADTGVKGRNVIVPLAQVQREGASDVTVGDISGEYSHFDVEDNPELWKKRNR